MEVFSVTDVNRYIKNMVESDVCLGAIWVRGEISNFKRHHSGHCYFSLKDKNSVLRSVMFRSRAQGIKFSPKDGMLVVAGGTISVFERDGQYQLYIDRMVPEGIGELSLAYEQLKAKLLEEGLFDVEKKRRLPFIPGKVGIITSPTGAVIKDIVTVAKTRHSGIPLVLYPVQVQGEEAPRQIVQGLQAFNKWNEVDVIIIGRGGGSIEELWAFNDERVVRAIAASKIPVVSAVGHETDYTLSDFAADYRAATPSQAAEIVIPSRSDLIKQVEYLKITIIDRMNRQILIRRNKMEQVHADHLRRYLLRNIDDNRQLLDRIVLLLTDSLKRQLRERRYAFLRATEQLNAFNPMAVLRRGYGIVRTQEGRVVKDSSVLQRDEIIHVQLGKGRVIANVLEIEEGI